MDDPYLDLAYLLDEDYVATKSYNDLLAEGIPHMGGLAMLAAAEREGTLFGDPPISEPDRRTGRNNHRDIAGEARACSHIGADWQRSVRRRMLLSYRSSGSLNSDLDERGHAAS